MSEIYSDKLFYEFSPSSVEEWQSAIRKELKGTDYSKLIWESPEGIEIKPFYTQSDLNNITIHDFHSKSDNKWEITSEINIENEETANHHAKEALKNGADSITFVLLDKTRNDRCFFINESKQLSILLKNLPLEKITTRFISGRKTPVLIKLIKEALSEQITIPSDVKFVFDYDPVDFMTIQGRFFESEENDFNTITELINYCRTYLPDSRIIGISGYIFHNSGATLVQELAYSLAIASEYLSVLSEKGISISEISKHLSFNFGVGSVYFMEIAKLRAARILYERIIKAFDPECNEKMNIHTVSSEFNKSTCDSYTNLLRNTTEAMSAIIGGTDSLSIKTFDTTYNWSGDFSNRLARNIQIILKEESNLDKVNDPSAGSYYIENLTESFIEKTWNLFLEIEEKGGYIKAFKEGWIQKQITVSQNKRKESIACRKEILLGVNQFPDLKEKLTDKIPTRISKRKPSEKEKTAEPVKTFRAAEEFENLRIRTESMIKIPEVFLFTFGSLTHRKARAFFATNFFGCAGFEIKDNPGFLTVEDGITAILKSKPEIVVICSSDGEYVNIVPIIAERIKNETILVIAGYPEEQIEIYKKTGIEHFIHAKSNLLESLKNFQELIIKKTVF